jgi:hypothetical protein
MTSFTAELDQEAKITSRVLGRVPEDKLTWKPHPKSMTLGQLALHTAMIPATIAGITANDTYELNPAQFGNAPQPASVAEIAKAFEDGLTAAKSYLDGPERREGRSHLARENRCRRKRAGGDACRTAMAQHRAGGHRRADCRSGGQPGARPTHHHLCRHRDRRRIQERQRRRFLRAGIRRMPGGMMSIGAVAVAPSDPKVVWVGTGEADNRQSSSWGDGVYKSVNGGLTWTKMGLEETRHIGKIVVDPTDPNVVWVAAVGHLWGSNAERGVYKTTDGGATWKKVLYKDDNTGAIDLAMDPHDHNVVFAAMYQRQRKGWGFNGGGPGSGIYRTTDGGATWTEMAQRPAARRQGPHRPGHFRPRRPHRVRGGGGRSRRAREAFFAA